MFNVRQAVILAAGLGSRLRGAFDNRPKGFLKFGNKQIIEESIAKLIYSGINNIVIVTGYRFEFYDQLSEKYPFVHTILNPDFASTGSMLSLCTASQYVNSDFLLLESDLIYEYNALQKLKSSPEKNCILLSGKTGSGDEVYVGINGDRIVNMSKSRNDIECLGGELVGISRISLALYHRMLDIAQVKISVNSQYQYEDCLTDVSGYTSINYKCVENLAWTEIDDYNHLRRASEDVYPLIQQRDYQNFIYNELNLNILLNPEPEKTSATVKYAQNFNNIYPEKDILDNAIG